MCPPRPSPLAPDRGHPLFRARDWRGRTPGSRGPIIRTAAVGLTLLLVSSPAASASHIHRGRKRFPAPRTLPGSSPPATQRTETAREVTVVYNSRAGSVTLQEEVWDAEYWGKKALGFFWLGRRCTSLQVPPFSAEILAGSFSGTGASVEGTARLDGYVGEVKGPGSFNGHRFTVTVTSRAFRDRPWRCAQFLNSSFERESFWLSGWATTGRKRGR